MDRTSHLSYTRAVPAPQRHRGPVGNGGPLDRSSFVPLYYQLQEVLKEQIESGTWTTGEALPSEPELARRFGVSRRRRPPGARDPRGRPPDRPASRAAARSSPSRSSTPRAGGLSRSLVVPRPAEVAIQALDVRTADVEDSIRGELDVRRRRGDPAGHDLPVAARRPAEHQLLVLPPRRGRAGSRRRSSRAATVPADLVLADHGIELAQSRIAVETSQCGQFEADRFGIPHRASVFLASAPSSAATGRRHARSRSRASSTAATSSASGWRCPTPGRAGWRRCGSWPCPASPRAATRSGGPLVGGSAQRQIEVIGEAHRARGPAPRTSNPLASVRSRP